MKRKYGSNSIIITNSSIKCGYGCGRAAKYYSTRVKQARCAKSSNSCPAKKEKLSKTNTNPQTIKTTAMCDWGCGNVAHYQFKNGTIGCQKVNSMCPEIKKHNSQNITGAKRYQRSDVVDIDSMCSYGCGLQAKYQFKSGNFCCNKSPNQCDGKKETMRKNSQEKYGTDFAVQSADAQTKIRSGRLATGSWKSDPSLREKDEQWIEYTKNVKRITEDSWKSNQSQLNPKKQDRSNQLHLDHIFSIYEGYLQDIPPEIIGHWTNLQLILARENGIKSYKCQKTKRQLYEDYQPN